MTDEGRRIGHWGKIMKEENRTTRKKPDQMSLCDHTAHTDHPRKEPGPSPCRW
jgi:hypothetical protein